MKKRTILIVLLIVFLLCGAFAFTAYKQIFGKGVNLHGEKEWVLYLYKGATYDDFMDSLTTKDVLIHKQTFIQLAKYKKLSENIKPGRYVITDGMSNNSLANMIRGGIQSPVKITFNNIRTKGDFAENVSKNLLFTEEELLTAINDPERIKKYELNKENIMCIFIPNTYEIYWNISVDDFMEKMFVEYQRFWTEERKEKAAAAGFSPVEVSILASIVESETKKRDEMPIVAGLYINRLHDGWPLEADPTVKFALQDFELKRILFKHLEIDSPYNTYKYKGLPPGPICLPEPTTIDAVLNYEHHKYFFMCAKPDFSGYHNFAVTNAQHEQNARKYQEAYRVWAKKQKNK